MALSTTTVRFTYDGDAATVAFPAGNLFFADSDVKVYVDDVLQVLDTDYTVAGEGTGSGTVTFEAASTPGVGTDNVVIYLDIPDTQVETLPLGGDLPSTDIERALNRLTLQVQQLSAKVNTRSLVLADSDGQDDALGALPAESTRASKYLSFDADGDPQAVTTVEAGSVVITAFAETFLDDANQPAVQATLGLAAVINQGKHTIWVPSSAMKPTATAGCATLASTETTAGRPDVTGLDFDSASEEHAQFSVEMPKSWNGGTVTFRATYAHLGGQTAGLDGVAWGLSGRSFGDDESLDQAFGTEVVVTKDDASSETRLRTDESAAVTLAGTPAGGELCVFDVARVVANGADDLDIDARLLGIALFITINAATDA